MDQWAQVMSPNPSNIHSPINFHLIVFAAIDDHCLYFIISLGAAKLCFLKTLAAFQNLLAEIIL